MTALAMSERQTLRDLSVSDLEALRDIKQLLTLLDDPDPLSEECRTDGGVQAYSCSARAVKQAQDAGEEALELLRDIETMLNKPNVDAAIMFDEDSPVRDAMRDVLKPVQTRKHSPLLDATPAQMRRAQAAIKNKSRAEQLRHLAQWLAVTAAFGFTLAATAGFFSTH